jgi:tRNA A37 N6-isopentenylltransferase MiaA
MNVRTRQLAKRQRTWFRHQMQAEPVAPALASDPAWVELVASGLR